MSEENINKPMRIWGVWCPFNKRGAPVLGTFGSTSESIVIIRAVDWANLCREIPELGTRQFEVGTYE
jgi:hypothetical protein